MMSYMLCSSLNSGNLHPLICQTDLTWLFLFTFYFTGVLGLSAVGVVRRSTTKTLFAKHVIKCTTFDVSHVLYVVNNYQRERSCISNLETRDSSARITTSNKVRLESPYFIHLWHYSCVFLSFNLNFDRFIMTVVGHIL